MFTESQNNIPDTALNWANETGGWCLLMINFIEICFFKDEAGQVHKWGGVWKFTSKIMPLHPTQLLLLIGWSDENQLLKSILIDM